MADVPAFVKIRNNVESPRRVSTEIAELVLKVRGEVRVGIGDHFYHVVMSKDGLDSLRQHPAVSRVYTGKIPRSTIRGYASDLLPAVEYWHEELNRGLGETLPMSVEEAAVVTNGLRGEPQPYGNQ